MGGNRVLRHGSAGKEVVTELALRWRGHASNGTILGRKFIRIFKCNKLMRNKINGESYGPWEASGAKPNQSGAVVNPNTRARIFAFDEQYITIILIDFTKIH